MVKILAMTGKDIRLLLRDRAGFFVTFVFPLVYAAFLGAILGNHDGRVSHFFMPPWLQDLGAVGPVRWAIVAMEEAVWRGRGVTASLKPCAYLVVFGVVCFAMGARAFRWSAKTA